MKTYTFGKMLFPKVSLWNRDFDKIAPEEVLLTLAACTATPLERIRQTALRRYEGRLYLRHTANGNTNWLLPLGIYHRTHRKHGLLFCPTCLQNDGTSPYFRTHWRLASSSVCVACGTYLLDRCPACANPVTFFRVELGHKSAYPDVPISHCFHCNLDLASVPAEKAIAADIRSQAELGRVLWEGWKADVFFPHQYFDVLHQLVKVLGSPNFRCAALQKAVDKYTGWSPEEQAPAVRLHRVPFELLPLATRAGLIRQAQWLLREWPVRFTHVMRQHQMTSTPLLHSMTAIPFWYQDLVQL